MAAAIEVKKEKSFVSLVGEIDYRNNNFVIGKPFNVNLHVKDNYGLNYILTITTFIKDQHLCFNILTENEMDRMTLRYGSFIMDSRKYQIFSTRKTPGFARLCSRSWYSVCWGS